MSPTDSIFTSQLLPLLLFVATTPINATLPDVNSLMPSMPQLLRLVPFNGQITIDDQVFTFGDPTAVRSPPPAVRTENHNKVPQVPQLQALPQEPALVAPQAPVPIPMIFDSRIPDFGPLPPSVPVISSFPPIAFTSSNPKVPSLVPPSSELPNIGSTEVGSTFSQNSKSNFSDEFTQPPNSKPVLFNSPNKDEINPIVPLFTSSTLNTPPPPPPESQRNTFGMPQTLDQSSGSEKPVEAQQNSNLIPPIPKKFESRIPDFGSLLSAAAPSLPTNQATQEPTLPIQTPSAPSSNVDENLAQPTSTTPVPFGFPKPTEAQNLPEEPALSLPQSPIMNLNPEPQSPMNAPQEPKPMPPFSTNFRPPVIDFGGLTSENGVNRVQSMNPSSSSDRVIVVNI